MNYWIYLEVITQDEEKILTRIINIWESSKMMYGSRKISALLKKEGINLSRYQVLKFMKSLGISALYNKNTKFKPYKSKSHITQYGENLLNQKFDICNEREVLTSDLTYVKYTDKFAYVCFVI